MLYFPRLIMLYFPRLILLYFPDLNVCVELGFLLSHHNRQAGRAGLLHQEQKFKYFHDELQCCNKIYLKLIA